MAPTRSYLIHLVRAQQFRDPQTFHQLDALPSGSDAFEVLAQQLRGLRRDDAEVDEQAGRAFDVVDTDIDVDHRALWFKGEAGSFGTPGATTNVDTGTRRPYGDREANMVAKRAMLYLPARSEMGVLFCERVAASHLRINVEKSILRPVAHGHDVTFNVSAYVDIAAWTRYLDEAEGHQVKSIWRPTTIEGEVTSGGRDAGELKMSLSGGAALAVATRLKRFLMEKYGSAEPTQASAMEIDVPRSLRPANEDEFERRRIEVALDGQEGRKTLIIERDEPPAFIYELEGNPADQTLRQTWQADIDRLSQEYGENVLPRWQPEA